MSVKSSWKKVGGDFKELGVDLGKSIVRTVKFGARKATEWAEEEPEKKDAPKEEQNRE